MEENVVDLSYQRRHVVRTFYFILVIFSTTICTAQNSVLDVGVRFQKSVDLYYENGVIIQYSNEKLIDHRLYLGLSYVSSRLGSAINSNALKQDNFILSGSYFFRPERRIQPLIRVNTGYFIADYEEEIFDDLPNSSILFSPEMGLCFKTRSPLKLAASLGYNLITGDGVDGPGSLFPLFIQTSITWNVLSKTVSDEK